MFSSRKRSASAGTPSQHQGAAAAPPLPAAASSDHSQDRKNPVRSAAGKVSNWFNGVRPETGDHVIYAAVGRQRTKPFQTAMISESFDPHTPSLAVELGRKMMARRPPPGWDDVNCEGWRAVKLPVHDLAGCNSYVCVFGVGFDAKRAQAIVERFALMLGPMIDGQLLDGEAPHPGAAEVVAADTARDQQQMLELHRVMEPILARELEHANSSQKIEEIQNQISEVRAIMMRNVEMILDREEALKNIEDKAKELRKNASGFRRKARQLRRWHLMNQVKWGVAIGTLVTASIALPIALIVAA